MLSTIKNAIQIKDIRKKLFFTFCMLILIRIGANLPSPGVDEELLQEAFADINGLNILDAFTGGGLSSMSVFALSITPYITASIIMQLLTIAIPKLEELHRSGEDGRKKIAAATRYVTVGLALIESTAMGIGFGRSGYLENYEDHKVLSILLLTVTLTAGSACLMWIGERITEHGIGNGISVVLMINIIAKIPSDLASLYGQFVKGKDIAQALLAGVVILLIVLFVVIFVIILQDGERRVPVQYSQKIQGRRSVGGQSSHIPIKVNTSGVVPVIFASSMVQFPIIIAQFLGKSNAGGIGGEILNMLSSSNWCDPNHLKYTWGLVLYIALTVFFAYFYTSITFNPLEIADNMKKNGGFIPGIRPGKSTVNYLRTILNYTIFVGVVGLIIVQVIPFFFNGVYGASVSFGGTSLIIVVSVILETMKQIEAQMLVRSYKGFLNV